MMKKQFTFSFALYVLSLFQGMAQTSMPSRQRAIGQLHIEKKANGLELHLETLKLISTEKLVTNEATSNQVEGDIIGVIIDQFDKPIDTLWLGSPSKQRLEYPAGEGGALATMIQENTHADVLLRFQYLPEMKAIRFLQMNANNALQNLITLPIRLK